MSNFQHTDIPIKYPLAKETITEVEIQNLIGWLKGYPRLTKGELTVEFEKKWAEYIGTKYSVFVNSGSSANLLMIYALKELGRLNGKVIVPSVGWVTTISPLIQFGIEPVMVDADKKTFGIDLEQTEFLLKTEDISAIIFVQVLGVPHYKEELLNLSKKYNVPLLEDGCAALGSSYEDGTMVGRVGDMSTFSFYFGHQFSTIEGGMVNTDDKDLYELLVSMRSHGWDRDCLPICRDSLRKEWDVDNFTGLTSLQGNSVACFYEHPDFDFDKWDERYRL